MTAKSSQRGKDGVSDVDEFLDTPTAVHLANLSGRINNMNLAHTHSTQLLESLTKDVRVLTERSAQALGHQENMARIWQRMEKAEASIAGVEKRQNGMRALVVGAAAVTGLLVSLLSWVGIDQIKAIRETAREVRAEGRRVDERMDRVEVYLAGPKQDPYER